MNFDKFLAENYRKEQTPLYRTGDTSHISGS
jgi:hypothetical protein